MKYALVTGSSRGIGLEIAIGLLEKGYFVFFTYLNSKEELCRALIADSLKIYEGRCQLIKVDLASFEAVEDLHDNIVIKTNRIDIIVFNAGVTDRTPFPEILLQQWRMIQDIFVNIPVFILQKLDYMLSQSASVLFVGSLMGVLPHSTSLAYGVSKAAVHALVTNLMKFYSERAIRVNAIAPGFVDTEWQKSKPVELRQKIESKIALRRFADIEEIRDMALHIISNGYVNGSVIKIDGGYNFC